MNMAGKGAYKKSTTAPYKRKSYMKGAGVSGRGFYKGFGADLGRHIGAFATSATGIPGLSALGEKLGRMGSKATGWGAYKVHHNSLIADIPVVSNPSKEGATQIRHREYIGDVLSATDFTIQYQLPINASLQSTFPWASVVGSAYQQYQVNGMIFEFVSTSGDTTSGSTALGNVSMATQYDSILPPFTSKLQLLNQEFSTSVKPSVNGIHPIECAPSQTSIPLLYTRSSSVPSGADQRLYDLGVFYLATEGQQSAGQVIGELWVTYDLLLYKPQLSGDSGGLEPTEAEGYAHYSLRNVGQNGFPFSDSSNSASSLHDDIGLKVDKGIITFPVGTQGVYYISLWHHLRGNATKVSTEYIDGNGNLGPNVFDLDTSSWKSSANTTDGLWFQMVNFPVRLTTSCQLTCSMGATASGGQWDYGDLIVRQYPDVVV
jgi:hypothetical protein